MRKYWSKGIDFHLEDEQVLGANAQHCTLPLKAAESRPSKFSPDVPTKGNYVKGWRR